MDEWPERAVLCEPREVCEAAGASIAVASAPSGSMARSLLCLDTAADSWRDGGGASKCAAGVSNNHDATLDRGNCSPGMWRRLLSMDVESRSRSACCGPASAMTGSHDFGCTMMQDDVRMGGQQLGWNGVNGQ